MKYFWKLAVAALLVVGLAGVAHSAPTANETRGSSYVITTISFDSSTDDSPSFTLGALCSATVVHSGTGTVQLFGVANGGPTSGGTQIGSNWTASTTTPYQFAPGGTQARAVASVASPGTQIRVICSYSQVSSSGGVNIATDTDGDGNVDYVVVRGDYNGDGLVSPQDITDAQDDLFAAAGSSPKTVLVEGGPYTMAGETFDWNQTNRGFIELNSYTSLVCRPGTVIEGFALASDYTSLAATKPITNKTDPATNISVSGCKFSNPAFTTPYDASGFTTRIHYGTHFEGVTNLSYTGNTVEGSSHTCLYVRDSVDAKLHGNSLRYCGAVMEHGGDTTTLNGSVAAKAFTIALQSGDCASWTCAAGDPIMLQLDSGEWHHADVISVSTDTLTIRPVPPSAAASGNTVFLVGSTRQNGIYLFSQDTSTLRTDVAFNTIEDVGGVGLHMRSNDNTVIARDLKFRYNNISRTIDEGIDIRGMIGGLVQGNEFNQTQGIEFIDDNSGEVQYCYDDAPNVECSDNVSLIGNTWRANRYEAPNLPNGAVRWGRGHSRVKFKGNLIDGTVDGNCMDIVGNSPGSIIEDTTLQNCGGDGLTDGLGTSGVAITTPLVIKNTTIKDVGLSGINDSDANGIRFDMGHTALQFDGLVISGCTDDCIALNGSTATSGLTFRNFTIDATRSGFIGRMTEAQAGTMACDADVDQRWVMTTNASTATDCTFASGTGATENGCYCTGGAWTDYGAPTPGHKAVESIKNTGAQNDMAFISGVIKNIPDNQEGIRIQGSGAMNRLQVRDVYFSNDGPGRLSADDIGTALRISSTTVSAAGVSEISCGANVTVCVSTDLDDTEISGDSFVRTTQTPNGACVTGALMVDTNNTGAGTTLYVCENSAWIDID